MMGIQQYGWMELAEAPIYDHEVIPGDCTHEGSMYVDELKSARCVKIKRMVILEECE